MSEEKPILEEIKKLINYMPETGSFVWTGVHAPYLSGRAAGSVKSEGYVVIKVLGRSRAAHRLAWMFHYGAWPEFSIDHIDRDKTNNKISNLRKATDLQNQMNTGPRRNNTHGLKGISYQPRHKAWIAQITIAGKNINLGRFKDPAEAAHAYDQRAFAEHGEFAYLNFPKAHANT